MDLNIQKDFLICISVSLNCIFVFYFILFWIHIIHKNWNEKINYRKLVTGLYKDQWFIDGNPLEKSQALLKSEGKISAIEFDELRFWR